MNKNKKSMRSQLAEIRALGPGGGSHHWWLQRLTSIALIPLSIYFVFTFFIYVVFGGYAGAVHWLRSPVSATMVILTLAVGFHHGASGLQVVIEDYVHCECTKLGSIIVVKFLATLFALIGILAVLKILFGV